MNARKKESSKGCARKRNCEYSESRTFFERLSASESEIVNESKNATGKLLLRSCASTKRRRFEPEKRRSDDDANRSANEKRRNASRRSVNEKRSASEQRSSRLCQ